MREERSEEEETSGQWKKKEKRQASTPKEGEWKKKREYTVERLFG
jgi:hypothetical protein